MYKPLENTQQIRLLQICPGDPTDGLRGIIEHVQVDKPATSYQALSYASHDATLFPDEGRQPTESIQIDDKILRIGENLASFLRAMRTKRPDSGWWWIDSICINQSDIRERNNQVHRIRTIFQTAQQVVVWLGPLAYDSNSAVGFLKLVFTDCPRDHESQWFKSYLSANSISTQWRALTRLLWRVWWTRIWSVQEIVVAQKITLMCGASQLSWAELEYAVIKVQAALQDVWEHVSSIGGLTIVRDRFDAIARLAALRRRKDNLNLLVVFRSVGGNECADPRDKIYGLLGVVEDGHRYYPAPDYTMTVERVYRKFFVTMVMKTGELDFLSLVHNSLDDSSLSTLPTWCPDTRAMDFNNIPRLNPGYNLPTNSQPKFHASGDRKSAARTCRETLALFAPGICVDAIDGVFPGGFDNSMNLKYTCQPKSIRSMYNSDKLVFEAIWKSFVAGADVSGMGGSFLPPDSFGELFARLSHFAEKEHLELCKEKVETPFDMAIPLKRPKFIEDDPIAPFATWYKYHRDAIFAGRTLKSWIEPQTPKKLSVDGASQIPVPLRTAFRNSWTSANATRRMATTDKGYICMVPELARTGDLVCVLFGCRIPVILRQKEDYFIFIGESYVHGIMFGESMTELRKGGHKVREFKLY